MCITAHQGRDEFEHVLDVGLAMHVGDLHSALLRDVIIPAPQNCNIPIALEQIEASIEKIMKVRASSEYISLPRSI